MAYTSPTTRSTGNSISAAQWNADMVDNIKWVAGDSGKPSCRVYNSANLAIVTATTTTLTFDSERWDNGGMHSTSVNTSRITVPSGGGGKYLIGGSATFAQNATGFRILEIVVNATTGIARNTYPGQSTVDSGMEAVALYQLSAADYVELRVYQTSGGNLNVTANAAYSAEFYAIWQAL